MKIYIKNTYIFEQLEEISCLSDTLNELCVGAAMIDRLDEAVHLLALLVDLILKQRDNTVLVTKTSLLISRGASLSRNPW